jgi:hypothetical protein
MPASFSLICLLLRLFENTKRPLRRPPGILREGVTLYRTLETCSLGMLLDGLDTMGLPSVLRAAPMSSRRWTEPVR